MIGFEAAVIIALFNDHTAVKHLFVAYGLIFILSACMLNQFFEVPYGAFKVLNVIALVLQIAFYYKIPAGVWPEYARKGTGLFYPKRLFAALFGLTFLGNIMFSFGISVAEGVRHGVSVFYLSFAAFAIAGYLLLRRFRFSPLRFAPVSAVISVVGFILAIVSLYAGALALPACALLGPGAAVLVLIPYYGILMTKRRPSRFIPPALMAISLVVSMLIPGALIEAFRANTAFLYTVYLAIAVAAAALYLAAEPYLLYSFRGRPLLSDEGIARLAETETADDAAPMTERQSRLAAKAFDKLSARELAVAEMMMRGFSYGDICGKLKIKKTTAYWYRNQLFDKLQIKSVREMFTLAGTPGKEAAEEALPKHTAPHEKAFHADETQRRLLMRKQD
jgi:DNA-binding CsgD family transcriptional regulator